MLSAYGFRCQESGTEYKRLGYFLVTSVFWDVLLLIDFINEIVSQLRNEAKFKTYYDNYTDCH